MITTNANLVTLIILDGWGFREAEAGNAIAYANPPFYKSCLVNSELSLLNASGKSVGLPDGQMGNSEVGHLNIGAGRVVLQELPRINEAILSGSLFEDPKFKSLVSYAQGRTVHLIGLLGDGGVHSSQVHLSALLNHLKLLNIHSKVHLITDGRDTPTKSAVSFLKELSLSTSIDQEQIASISGRYFAMDRDKRWDRTIDAAKAILGTALYSEKSAEVILTESYLQGVTDEFVLPESLIRGRIVSDGDVLLFYNFRADRMRQLVSLFAHHAVANTEGLEIPNNLHLFTFTEYEKGLDCEVLFPKQVIPNTLAETLSKSGLKQFHTAETEKYAHVTYFFNGGREDPFWGEEREIVPSPKVKTYDLKPEMSAKVLTEVVLKAIDLDKFSFILVNFANPDMVGHTGNFDATTQAIRTVDHCAERIVKKMNSKNGVTLITADHGNAEMLIHPLTGQLHTYHTKSLVPLFVEGAFRPMLRPTGVLADIAPTILDLLRVKKPHEMSGNSLLNY